MSGDPDADAADASATALGERFGAVAGAALGERLGRQLGKRLGPDDFTELASALGDGVTGGGASDESTQTDGDDGGTA